jgi:hypothetical protein
MTLMGMEISTLETIAMADTGGLWSLLSCMPNGSQITIKRTDDRLNVAFEISSPSLAEPICPRSSEYAAKAVKHLIYQLVQAEFSAK